MAEAIYMILSMAQALIIMLLMARYIFQEPKMEKYGKLMVGIMVTVSSLVYVCAGEDAAVGCILFCVGLYLALARKRKRIGGFFLVLPIIGIGFGVYMPFGYILESLVKNQELIDTIDVAFDVIGTVALLLFLWKGKQWRQRFDRELQYRQLRSWERRLLIGVGMLLIVVYCSVIDVPMPDSTITFFIFMVNFAMFILTVTVIGMIFRGNKEAYYEGIAKMNEQYLELELQHFEAYRLTQQETRRMQHDMKHHIACLQHLCHQGNLEEIQDYLNGMGEMVYSTDMEIQCGNALANAICTHKHQLALQKEIRLEVNGTMPERITLKPIDLCTILSNALDNAIEAVEDLASDKRWVHFDISTQGQMLFFRFSNPIEEEGAVVIGKTTKQESMYHGFGLQNIQYAVGKYHGQMLMEIENNEGAEFVLSIMVGEE